MGCGNFSPYNGRCLVSHDDPSNCDVDGYCIDPEEGITPIEECTCYVPDHYCEGCGVDLSTEDCMCPCDECD